LITSEFDSVLWWSAHDRERKMDLVIDVWVQRWVVERRREREFDSEKQ
jgi:hypothetical protein